jgi:hypothetical protein
VAALPFDLSEKTVIEPVSAVRSSTATDGTLRYQDFSSIAWRRIGCAVEALSDNDRDTLLAFLETNKTSEIDVSINGLTFRGRIIPAEPVKATKSSGRSTVTFGLKAKSV